MAYATPSTLIVIPRRLTVIPAQAGIQNPGWRRRGGRAGCGFLRKRE